MQTDDGRQLDGSIQESAETVHALAAEVRTHLDSYDADTRQLLGALADEVDTVAAELLEMRSRIPQMEAESLFLREARAQAEARGEQVLGRGRDRVRGVGSRAAQRDALAGRAGSGMGDDLVSWLRVR
ncbi:hypothetical protein ACFQX6_65690 [Streptosporangium lutulentum]